MFQVLSYLFDLRFSEPEADIHIIYHEIDVTIVKFCQF